MSGEHQNMYDPSKNMMDPHALIVFLVLNYIILANMNFDF